MRVLFSLLFLFVSLVPSRLMSQALSAEVMYKKGNTTYRAGNYEQAIPWFSAAVVALQKNKNHEMALRSMDALRLCYQNIDNFSEALHLAELAFRYNRDSLANKFHYNDIEYDSYKSDVRTISYKVNAPTVDYLAKLVDVVKKWPSGRRSTHLLTSMQQGIYASYKKFYIDFIEKQDAPGLLGTSKAWALVNHLSEIQWPRRIPVDSLERIKLAPDTLLAQKYFQLSLTRADSAASFFRRAAILRMKTDTWSTNYARVFIKKLDQAQSQQGTVRHAGLLF